MRPVVVFTENELKRIIPDWKESFLVEHKGDCAALFRNLGGDPDFGIEVQRELTTRNKFGEIDNSTRYVLCERLDKAWLVSGNASDAAKLYTDDVSLTREIGNMKKGKFVVNKDKEKE